MENNRLFELADELKALRDRKDALENELKQVNMDIDNVDWHLSNLMGETETQNFTRAGTMFFLSTKTHASAKAGQKDELFGALRANGYGDLIRRRRRPTISAGRILTRTRRNPSDWPCCSWLPISMNTGTPPTARPI